MTDAATPQMNARAVAEALAACGDRVSVGVCNHHPPDLYDAVRLVKDALWGPGGLRLLAQLFITGDERARVLKSSRHCPTRPAQSWR